jgi:hypothetical protein
MCVLGMRFFSRLDELLADYLHGVHVLVALLVVSCVDEDLVEDLVQARHVLQKRGIKKKKDSDRGSCV